MHRAGRTEVYNRRREPFLRNAQRLDNKLLHAVAGRGADRYNRNAEPLRQRGNVDRAAVSGQLVHHVQRQHHRQAKGQQLQREVEVALQVCGVDNVDNSVRLGLQNEIPRDNLLRGVGAQGVNSRQINHCGVLLLPNLPGFLVNGDAGKIADVLVGAGELVKQRRFAAVLISGKRKNHTASSSTVMLCASSFRSVKT